jgi:hypothetical protein
MNRLLIRSDRSLIRSDEAAESFHNGLAQTPPPTGARLAADRTGAAWHIGRDLQALRSPELPLRRRTGTWPEAISVYQPTRRATATGLRAQRRACAGRPVDRQLSQIARDAQRGLRDQHGTPAASRGSRINRDGPGPRRPRLHQGGRHPGRHGCVFSCRRHPAVRSGGDR